MSNLESIVPPVAMCKLIPAGEFEDSALVWVKSEKHFQALDVMDYEYKVVARDESKGGFPAPTLEEIINELPDEYNDGRLDIGTDYLEYITYDEFLVDDAYFCSEQDGFAAAALRLWFKVKGVEVEK